MCEVQLRNKFAIFCRVQSVYTETRFWKCPHQIRAMLLACSLHVLLQLHIDANLFDVLMCSTCIRTSYIHLHGVAVQRRLYQRSCRNPCSYQPDQSHSAYYIQSHLMVIAVCISWDRFEWIHEDWISEQCFSCLPAIGKCFNEAAQANGGYVQFFIIIFSFKDTGRIWIIQNIYYKVNKSLRQSIGLPTYSDFWGYHVVCVRFENCWL